MPISESRVQSEFAARYLIQLCKHFQHKVAATYQNQEPNATGHIDFSFGTCDLTAEEEILTIRAEAATETDLRTLEEVVARHLERFAFRDNPPIVWATAA